MTRRSIGRTRWADDDDASRWPQTQDNLLFAIPKKGRLHDKILKLLEGAGLSYYRVRLE